MAERKWGWLRWSWGKLAVLGSWAAVGGLAFYLGRVAMMSQATAGSPRGVVRSQEPQMPVSSPAPAGDPNEVLAYIHGTIPITRQELAEYLIARQGKERLDLL